MLTQTQAECVGGLFSAFLHEVVQFEGLLCTRHVALTFEGETTDNVHEMIDVAGIPQLLEHEHNGEVLDGDTALRMLREGWQPSLPLPLSALR